MKTNMKNYCADILIIFLSGLLSYGIYGVFYMLFKINIGVLPILLQTFLGALCEFGLMGLGIVIVCVRSKEGFVSFGLKKEKLLLTIGLSALSCLPAFIYILMTNETITYFPLQNVNFTKSVLAAGFPVNVVGILFIDPYSCGTILSYHWRCHRVYRHIRYVGQLPLCRKRMGMHIDFSLLLEWGRLLKRPHAFCKPACKAA